MLKALMPVDGSACAFAAVHHVITLVRDREPLEVHLVNAQAPLHGAVTQIRLGSVTHATIHAMDSSMPVTLVKGRAHPDAEAA